MKAYILHLFPSCGGGERLSLEIARTMKELGHTIIYITNSRRKIEDCSRLFGAQECYNSIIEVRSLVESVLSTTGRFVRYRRLHMISSIADVIEELDGCIIDTSSNIPIRVDVSYIHYPVIYRTTSSNAFYWGIYDWLVTRKARKLFGMPRLLLTNSTWTAQQVRKAFGVDSLVLYPPVDVDHYRYDGRTKEKVIVTVSRFVPEKNLHVLPRIASKLPDYEWYLVGTTADGGASKRVIEKINVEIKRNRAGNFHVVTNAPREELRKLLLVASLYVHPPFTEHFGIAVVEAMAAGAVPVVYRDGGAWTDVASKLDLNLGYTNIDEVPAIVKMLESGKIEELREKAIEYAENFSTRVFRERFARIFDEYLQSSRH